MAFAGEGRKKRRIAISIANVSVRFLLDILIYIFVVAAVFFVVRYSFNFCYRIFGDAPVDDAKNAISLEITISENEDCYDLARMLENNGLILDRFSFFAKMKLDKALPKPGTYEIKSDMNYSEILAVASTAADKG